MKIIVNSIAHHGDNIIVICDSCIGTIKGIWRGRNSPLSNFVYHVEFTLDDIDCEHINVLSENKNDISVSLKKIWYFSQVYARIMTVKYIISVLQATGFR